MRVVKLGGSLLDWPELPGRFTLWAAEQPTAVHLVVVGGGAAADAQRRLWSHGAIGDEAAHWESIIAMRANAAALLRAGMPGVWVEAASETPRRPGWYWLDPERFMRQVDPLLAGGPLPASWDVTSDSIAARVAVACSAAQLVLLKSCDAPPDAPPEELSRRGLVDRAFPPIARGIEVVWINLRAQNPR